MTKFDLEDIEKHYANMDDGDLIWKARHETYSLRPGVLEIIQNEIIKRGLNPDIIANPATNSSNPKNLKKPKKEFNLFDLNIKGYLKSIPLWLKIINGINLIPILIWPLIFLFSFFFLDNPNMFQAFGSIILVNSYPFVLVGLTILSFYFYKKDKLILSISIPIIVTSILIIYLMDFFHYKF